MSARTRRPGLVLVVLALLAMLTHGAGAQDVEDLPNVLDGEYTGRMVLSGSFGFSEAGTTVTWTGGFSGPIQLTIAGGTADGTWSTSGGATIDGNLADVGSMSGSQTIEASGSITGDAGTYRMVGTATTIGSVTVNVAGVSQSASSDATSPADLPITDLLQTCDQLVGRFDQEIKQDFQDIGFSETLTGTITLVREPTSEETNAELDALQDALTTALEWIDTIGTSDVFPAAGVGTLLEVVQRAADVAATLEGPNPCPASQQQYLELAADTALRAMEAIVAADARGVGPSSGALRRAVTAALATGIAGEPGAAAALEGVRDIVDGRWSDALAAGDFASVDTLETVRLAAQMGWDLPNGAGGTVSASDVLLVLGG